MTQDTTQHITPPNHDLDILKQNFPQCFDKDGNFLLEKFKDNLHLNEVNYSSESYALQWLGKSYARMLASDATTKRITENHTHNQLPQNQNSQNILIKGDNLEVLKHLSNAYYQKIKMIYIDPPYNTGGDGFIYQDDRKFTLQDFKNADINDEIAQKIIKFTQSKSNSHSAWLTFMYPRLYVAKSLLKDDGVIFVSIDDNEVAQLRLLMDEIFGEENFVVNGIWEKVKIRKNSAKWFSDSHDHILIYCKNKDICERNLLPRTDLSGYKNPDNDPRGVWIPIPIYANHKYDANYKITKPNGTILERPQNNYWRLSEESYLKHVKENRLWWGEGNGYPMIKRFLTEVQDGLVPKSIFYYNEVGGNPHGDNELKKLFNDNKLFENPKSVTLIKHLTQIATTPHNSDLILDFFAGSGTTGDAVMQLNAEDGGDRRYILVQIDEAIDAKKNKTAYDFVKEELKVEKPTIFEITKERLKRASEKVKNDIISKKITQKSKEIEALDNALNLENKDDRKATLETEIKALEKQDIGFRVFEMADIWDNYNELIQNYDKNMQVQLFEPSVLTESDLESLMLTWKTYDGILLTEGLVKVHLGEYVAYYGGNKLYLMNKGFDAGILKILLEKIDQDKDFNPLSIIAFGLNFDSNVTLALGNSIKHDRNKKKSTMDLILRN